MAKKVVISESTVTAGQLKDLFRMIDDGTIGFYEMKSILENPNKFTKNEKTGLAVTIVRAINILGASKVFTLQQANEVWGINTVNMVPIVRYSEKTLREVAEANKKGEADWRLVYIVGSTLLKQRKIIGTNQNQQPCFYKNNDWYTKDKEKFWAEKKPETAGNYHLINFKGLFGGLNYQNQEIEIQKFGNNFERTNPHVFGEAILAIFKISGERIAENWYHRSSVLGAGRDRVSVGGFDAEGLRVNNVWVDFAYDNLRVSLFRKFEN